jgi:hypothetical protein
MEMQMLKIPQWISAHKQNNDAEDFTVPPIAALPTPDPAPKLSAQDEDAILVQRAAALHAQLKRSIETAQVDLAEAILGRQGDQQKIGFLEKETAQLRLEIAQKANDIQTLQAQIEEYRRFMDLWKDMNDKTRQIFDRFGVKGQPKKERKPKAKKAEQQSKRENIDRQETAQSAQTVE